jgi:hypothetical protein
MRNLLNFKKYTRMEKKKKKKIKIKAYFSI